MDKCICTGKRSCPEPLGYRVRSSRPIWGVLWPRPGARELEVAHRCLAISLAAKSNTEPGAAIEVVHLDSGSIVFHKPPPQEVRGSAASD